MSLLSFFPASLFAAFMATASVGCQLAGRSFPTGSGGTASGSPSTSASTPTSTSGSGEIYAPPEVFPDSCPDPGTYDWEMGVTDGLAPNWSVSGTVHLRETIHVATVCMTFFPVAPGVAGQILKGIGLAYCLSPKDWNTANITYRYTADVPNAPLDLAVEFFIDQNGNNKPDSGEIEGWFDSTDAHQIHDFKDARAIAIGAGQCPEHVDFWVGPMP